MTVGEGWQDISSAPRDGSSFDAWCTSSGGFRIADVHWEPRYSAFYSDELGILEDDCTHWRAIPEGPSA